jgi:hypothetical protein
MGWMDIQQTSQQLGKPEKPFIREHFGKTEKD